MIAQRRAASGTCKGTVAWTAFEKCLASSTIQCRQLPLDRSSHSVQAALAHRLNSGSLEIVRRAAHLQLTSRHQIIPCCGCSVSSSCSSVSSKLQLCRCSVHTSLGSKPRTDSIPLRCHRTTTCRRHRHIRRYAFESSSVTLTFRWRARSAPPPWSYLWFPTPAPQNLIAFAEDWRWCRPGNLSNRRACSVSGSSKLSCRARWWSCCGRHPYLHWCSPPESTRLFSGFRAPGRSLHFSGARFLGRLFHLEYSVICRCYLRCLTHPLHLHRLRCQTGSYWKLDRSEACRSNAVHGRRRPTGHWDYASRLRQQLLPGQSGSSPGLF